jgi:hypothetical protein
LGHSTRYPGLADDAPPRTLRLASLHGSLVLSLPARPLLLADPWIRVLRPRTPCPRPAPRLAPQDLVYLSDPFASLHRDADIESSSDGFDASAYGVMGSISDKSMVRRAKGGRGGS